MNRKALQRFYFNLREIAPLRDNNDVLLKSPLAISLQASLVDCAFWRFFKIRLSENQIQVFSRHKRITRLLLDLLEFCACNEAISDYEAVKNALPYFFSKIRELGLLETAEQLVDTLYFQETSGKNESRNVGLLKFIDEFRGNLVLEGNHLASQSSFGNETQPDEEDSLHRWSRLTQATAFFTLICEGHSMSAGLLNDLIENAPENMEDADAHFSEAMLELEDNVKIALTKSTKLEKNRGVGDAGFISY